MTSPTADQKGFLEFLTGAGALHFGSFTLKSGRESPYFFNAGYFCTGPLLERAGDFYARAVEQVAPRATVVFGPAYKGVPLCVATAMALSRRTGREIGFLFDRKEAKSHGDAGNFVGMLPGPQDRLVLVDDVITDGKTKMEAVAQLRATFSAPIDGLVIAFDRMERSMSGSDAVEDFHAATGIPVTSIVTLRQLEQWLAAGDGPKGMPSRLPEEIRRYQEQYGVTGRK